MVVTGASSGIGRATAIGLARLGADVWLVGRDLARLEATVTEAAAGGATGRLRAMPVDLVDVDALGSFVRAVGRSTDHLDGLVHAAGALSPRYTTAPDGNELTLATHVLAPFRLTWLLSPLLRMPGPAAASRDGGGSIIVTVSSGGMYTQPFEVRMLDAGPDGYRGATVYARMKRAQVVLAHEWRRRWGPDRVASYAMHPGWVDTPGLAEGLPSFTKLGPLLRSPAEGADTVTWLAAGGAGGSGGTEGAGGSGDASASGGIWLDRRRRSEYRLRRTRRTPAQQRADGEQLWDFCADRTGLGAVDLPIDGTAPDGR